MSKPKEVNVYMEDYEPKDAVVIVNIYTIDNKLKKRYFLHKSKKNKLVTDAKDY